MERFAIEAAGVLTEALQKLIQQSGLEIEAPKVEPGQLEIPPERKLGDFAFPCFPLAKQLRKGPPQISNSLAEIILDSPKADSKTIGNLEVLPTGPYLNFRVKPDVALAGILKDVMAGDGNGDYGKKPANSAGKWILEYSSPNVAKPMHVGHLRTTVLGAALARVGAYRGFEVIRLNHLGDWGTQFGKLTVAMQKYKGELPAQPVINDLLKLYVQFHKDVETDPSLDDLARDAFKKLEEGDEEVTATWKKILDISLKEFEQIYKRLGVEFDHIWGESFYKDKMDPIIKDLREKKIMIEDEGAWIVPLTDEKGKEIAPCIIQKKDGATIYATRDIAAAKYRYDQFHFDRMSYIVGAEQRLHFKQVFGVLKKLGCEWVDKCEHIPFGLYRFKDAKLSTRKGNVVTLSDVLDETKEEVKKLLEKRAENTQVEGLASEIEEISEAVAIGAVLFFDLSSDPNRDVQFEISSVADFEGETGPYLQYAHTRCLSILRKATESGELKGEPKFDSSLLPNLKADAEVNLVKRMGQFPLQMDRTLQFSKANQLCNYLIDLTKDFNTFYRECRVLGVEKELTSARLMLVESTRRILSQGLRLLGIPLPNRM